VAQRKDKQLNPGKKSSLSKEESKERREREWVEDSVEKV
jgi:hypothetical protein